MKNVFLGAALGAGLLLCAGAYAADAPPAGAIAQCKDGTYFTGTTHSGACKGHQGVKTWLDKDKDASATSSTKSSAAPAPAATTGSTAATSDSKKSKSSKSTPAASTTAASSGPAPAGATAKCKDGTYYTGTAHSGACKGHKGVADWLDGGASATAAKPAAPAAPAATPAAAPASAAPAAPATPAAAPAATPAPTPAPAAAPAHTPPTPASQITAKPGGGAGQVWVNSSSKVYHCQGDEWYGKTKEGSYMTEAAAKAAGNRAARGKECGS